MPRVYISIGSNIDRENNIRGAVRMLRQRYGTLTLSRVYETPAEGFDGEAFYNLVAGLDTDEPVERVRQALANIETAHGRNRGGARFSARTLDLDLLLYDDLVRHADSVDIPRGEITIRLRSRATHRACARIESPRRRGDGLGGWGEKFPGRGDVRRVAKKLWNGKHRLHHHPTTAVHHQHPTGDELGVAYQKQRRARHPRACPSV